MKYDYSKAHNRVKVVKKDWKYQVASWHGKHYVQTVGCFGVSSIAYWCSRLLSYISDWGLLEASVFPHKVVMWQADMQMASLSHNMVFHRPFKLDEWLCHAIRSPASSGGRGFAVGEVWSESGTLVATTAQEGLMRLGGARTRT